MGIFVKMNKKRLEYEYNYYLPFIYVLLILKKWKCNERRLIYNFKLATLTCKHTYFCEWCDFGELGNKIM